MPGDPEAAGSTFVWTMPGLWSLRCSSVAAMSISLAPATKRKRGELTQDEPPPSCRVPFGRGASGE